jgi:hypothetical protein
MEDREPEQTEPLDLRIRRTIRNWWIREGLAVPHSPQVSPLNEAVGVEIEEEDSHGELPDLELPAASNCYVSYYIRTKMPLHCKIYI